MTVRRISGDDRGRRGQPVPWLSGLAAVATIALLAACSPPGSDAGGGETEADPSEVSTDIGDEEIELTLYDGAGLKAIDDALIAAFERKHPNVSISTRFDPDDVQAQNAPRVLASDDPPDIARINALADIVSNGQLTNLDPWAEAYGWDELPEGQLAMYRVSDDGVRGSGSQYTVASGFVLTGLYWNQDVADQVGIGDPPTTEAELEEDLAAAKDAGVTPIMAGNQTGQVVTPIQSLINNATGRDPVNDWVFNVPGASIDSPEALSGVETVASWAEQGYFNEDANGTDSTGALGRFVEGESLFYLSGSWDASALQDQMGDNVGFALFPVGEADTSLAMSDPVSNFGIPANSDEKNAAAAFLDFLTSPEARQIVVDTGAGPSGVGDAPETDAGTLKAQVQEAFATLVEADGQVQFVQNATSGINADWLSETQQLVEGRVSPAEYLANIQAAYEEDLR
jgi:raffinose/stachyose/melibiose transport system substrate-binding protein